MLWAGSLLAEPVPVELSRSDAGWQLLRGGEPYFIRGAGGTASLDQLAAAGANSVRTWDALDVRGDDDVGVILDEAEALGLTVTVGIWLGHERHGFDYDDPDAVAAQLARAREIVETHKDHPALLLWGVGNEMEGFEAGDNPAIWSAVNDVAAMIKDVDPLHPTMTVTTYVHGERIKYVHERCPAIDIHGVNAYGPAAEVHAVLRKAGATKPFVLTEFGPLGPWEVGKTLWGAPIEPTSTEKAAFYGQSYRRGVLEQSDLALGAYAFVWGHKMEATPTWFGMWLADGARLGAVETMAGLWSGREAANAVPTTEGLSLAGSSAREPGERIVVSSQVNDADDDKLTATWMLRTDSSDLLTGGDYRPVPAEIDGVIERATLTDVELRLPEEPGPYRLYYTVRDTAGNAATANLPLLVRGQPRLRLPFAVYEDSFENMPWAPSGWMGGTDKLSLDGSATNTVHRGNHSIRMRYEGVFGWAGVAWQNPPNNWGESDGGLDLTGAGALEVWARGQYGGEKVGFGVGLLEADTAYPDSTIRKSEDIVLTDTWQRYRISLRGADLSSLKTGFFVTLTGRRTPVTIYLDSIRFVP